LRQAETTLHEALGRTPQPVRFVVSLRLGEPPSMEPLRRRLNAYPGLHFKLDPTSSWSEPLIAALVDTGAIESVDFKGYYSGSIVDQAPDPVLYKREIGNYGGGQFELGVGRGQIQYLASLFHGDAPNDVAPTGYNLPEPSPGLPEGPLDPAPSEPGFRAGTKNA
jgi:hypothetical protein